MLLLELCWNLVILQEFSTNQCSVQLASRSMRDQVKPVFILRLDTIVDHGAYLVKARS